MSAKHSIGEMLMPVSGHRGAKFAHHSAIARAEVRTFGNPCIRVRIENSDPPTGSAQIISLGPNARDEIIPALCKGEVISEKRPKGRDEPLIRPLGRLRFGPAIEVAFESVADQVIQRNVLIP